MSSTSETKGTKHIAPTKGGGRCALGRRPHAKNEDVACTSSLATIAPVDGAGSSASKCLKPDSLSEARKSCSGTLVASSFKHPDIGELSIDDGILERVNFTKLLPLELMLKIFGHLYEGDLVQCAQVSRKFRAIANHRALWEPLYKEVFEYSRPLLHVGRAQFKFREPHDWPQSQSDESIIVNPWKESFKQLKDGIHVRPGYASLYSGFGAGGRRLTQCDRLDQALRLIEAGGKDVEKLIFLHAGLYIPETTVMINSDIQIIGASAGPDIASQVIIEGRLTTTVTLAEGSQGAYLGWMTVRFAPNSGAVAAAIDAGNSPTRTYHSALQICGDSTALVEHCIIHSLATVGAAVYVKGSAANPKMRHCVVCNCKRGGICVTDVAQGQFEDCEIARNDGPGIEVEDAANPTVARCEVHHGKSYGIHVHSEGRGQFMENRIHSNGFVGIAIESHSDPKIVSNKIWGNQSGGVFVYNNGQGILENNEIFDNAICGVWVQTDGNPTLRCNKIYDGRVEGIYIYNKGRGVFEDNDIYRNAQAGVIISSASNPTLRRNRVYECRAAGIEIRRDAMATLESNVIFHNRFGGLFLATGVQPTLRDNRIYDNDDLVKKTVAKGGCLFEITFRTSPAMHDVYHCDTCNTAEKDTICLNCIRACHAGHTVRLVRYDSFFCRCGAGMLQHQCKLPSKVRDNDSTLPPVDSELQ